MKSRFHTLTVFILSIFALFALASCEGFGQGAKLKEDLKKKVDYENYPEYTIRVQADEGTGTVVTPVGDKTAKQTDTINLGFNVSSSYNFVKWQAISKTKWLKDKTVEDMSSYITFEKDAELKTETSFVFKTGTADLLLRPLCVQKLKIDSYSPIEDLNNRDSTISIKFNNNLSLENNLSNISITVVGLENGKSYFKDPEIKNDTIIIYADPENLIPVLKNTTKTVLVTLPADIYYEAEGQKVTLGTEYSFSYIIDHKTEDKAAITFELEDEDSGTFKINGEQFSSTEKEYSIGEEISLSFKKDNNYQFEGWDITGTSDGDILFEKTSEENAVTETATVTILKAVRGIHIKPNASKIPTVNLKFEQEDPDSGSLKIDSVSYDGSVKTFKKGANISTTFRLSSGYHWNGSWDIPDNDLLHVYFDDDYMELQGYNSSTRTATIFIDVIDGYLNTDSEAIVIKPNVSLIPKASVKFELTDTDCGTLKINGSTASDEAKVYEADTEIQLSFKKSDKYQWVDTENLWINSNESVITIENSSYDPDTKLATATAIVKTASESIVTISPNVSKIPVINIKFEMDDDTSGVLKIDNVTTQSNTINEYKENTNFTMTFKVNEAYKWIQWYCDDTDNFLTFTYDESGSENYGYYADTKTATAYVTINTLSSEDSTKTITIKPLSSIIPTAPIKFMMDDSDSGSLKLNGSTVGGDEKTCKAESDYVITFKKNDAYEWTDLENNNFWYNSDPEHVSLTYPEEGTWDADTKTATVTVRVTGKTEVPVTIKPIVNKIPTVNIQFNIGDDSGVLKVNNVTTISGTENIYKRGSEIQLSFKKSDDFKWVNWSSSETTTNILSFVYDNSTQSTYGYDADTKTATATLKIGNIPDDFQDTITITPVATEIPTIKLNFGLEDEGCGTLKINGSLANGETKTYKQDSVLTVTFKKDSDYKWEGWKFSNENLINGDTKVVDVDYGDFTATQGYDADTKTATMTLTILSGYSETLSIKPNAPVIPTVDIKFAIDDSNPDALTSFKVNGTNNDGDIHSYKEGDEITLTLKKSDDYNLIGWDFDEDQYITGESAVLEVNYGDFEVTHGYDSDTKTITLKLKVIGGNANTITIKPLTEKIPTVTCNFTQDDEDSGTLKINGLKNNGGDYIFKQGETITLTFKKNDDYKWTNWNFDKTDLFDEANPVFTADYSGYATTYGYDEDTKTATVILTVKKGYQDTITIKPVTPQTPTVNITFALENEASGSLRINGVLNDGAKHTYKQGEEVTVTFKKDDAYNWTNWVFSNASAITSAISIDYNGYNDTYGYDADTKTSTLKLKIKDSFTEDLTLTAKTVLIPTATLVFSQSNDNSGTLKINGTINDGLPKTYRQGDRITVSFKKSDDYKWGGWAWQSNYISDLTNANTPIQAIYEDHSETFGYDADTKTATITLLVKLPNGSEAGPIGLLAEAPIIPTFKVSISGAHGTLSPYKGTYTYKVGEPINIAYDAADAYCFTNWTIKDTAGELDSTLYTIPEDGLKSANTTLTVKNLPANADENYTITIEAHYVERPKIVSNTPAYESGGVLKDTRIQVTFDTPMDPNSIYYTADELNNLTTSIPETNLLPADSTKESTNVYGYVGNDGYTYFKNITITNFKTGLSILDRYGVPRFENANTLVIPTKSNENAPIPGTQILVCISGDLYATINDTEVCMTEAKKWNYKVNSNEDTQAPVWTKFKIYNADDVDVTISESGNPTENQYKKDDNIFNTYRLPERKLYLYGETSDPETRLTEGLVVEYKRLYSADYTKITSSKTYSFMIDYDADGICGTAGNPGAYDIPSNIGDGIYTFTFYATDQSGHYSEGMGPYYFLLDNSGPDINRPTSSNNSERFAFSYNIEKNGKTILDYDRTEVKYKKSSDSIYETKIDRESDHSEESSEEPNVRTIEINGLTSGTTYDVTVSYYDIFGNHSDYSFTRNTLPNKIETITALDASQTQNQVTLKWTKPDGNYAGAIIYYGTTAGSDTVFASNQEGSEQSYTISNLTYGKQYYFGFRAVDAGDSYNPQYQSTTSSAVSTVILPKSPSDFAVRNSTSKPDKEVYLSWTKPDSFYTSMVIKYGTDKDNLNKTTDAINNTNAVAATISDLEPGTKYYYQLVTCVTYNSTIYESTSNVASTVTLPETPNSFYVYDFYTSNSESELSVSWEKPTKGEDRITGYVIYQGLEEDDITDFVDTIAKNETTYPSPEGWEFDYTVTIPGLTTATTYYYVMKSYITIDGIDYFSEPTSIDYWYTKPLKPSDVAITNNTDTTATLSWTPPASNCTGYRVYYGTDKNSLISSKTINSTSTTTTTITGLTKGTKYYFTVVSRYESVESYKPEPLEVYTAPAAPTSLVITKNSTNPTKAFDASWTAPIEGEVTGYIVYYGLNYNNLRRYGTTTSTNITINADSIDTTDPIEPGKRYYVKVVPYYITEVNTGAALGGTSSAYVNLRPEKPTNITVTPSTSTPTTSVVVKWAAPSSGFVSAYRIYCGTSADSVNTYKASSSFGETSAEITGLTAGVQYYFAIRSYSYTPGNESESSDVKSIATQPAPATGVTVSQNSAAPLTAMNVSWTKPAGEPSGYKVYYGTSSSDISTLGATVTSGSTASTTVTGLTAGTYYYFNVVTYKTDTENDNNELISTASSYSSLYTRPNAVTNLSAVRNSSAPTTSIDLSWTKPTGGTVTGYKVYYGTSSTSISTLFTTITDGNTAGTTVTNLTPGTNYWFKVDSYCGSYSTTSIYANTASTSSYTTTLPNAITGLTVSATDTDLSNKVSSVSLSWTAPSVGNVTGYKISYRDITASGSMLDVTTTNTTYTISNLIPGHRYYFKVESYATSTSTLGTYAYIYQYTRPLKVSSYTFTRDTSTPGTKINIDFEYPTYGGYSGVMVLYHTTDSMPDSSYGNYTTGTSTYVSSLTPGTTYYFRLVTYAGSKPESATVKPGRNSTSDTNKNWTSTGFITCSTQPNPVTNLSVSATTTSSATLSWTNPTTGSLTGHKVYYKKNSESSYSEFNLSSDSSSLTSCTVTGLTAGTLYNFKVCTYTGTADNLSTESSVVSQYIKPNALASFSVSRNADYPSSRLNLSWSKASSGNTTGVVIYYGTTSACSTKLGTFTSSTSYTFTDLSANTRYYFKAIPYSGTYSSATALNSGTLSTYNYATAPNDVTNAVLWGSDGMGTIRLKWTNPSGSNFKGVNLFYNGSWVAYTTEYSAGATAYINYTIPNYSRNSSYSIVLRTYNTANPASAQNNSAGVTVTIPANSAGNLTIEGVTYSYSGLVNVTTETKSVDTNSDYPWNNTNSNTQYSSFYSSSAGKRTINAYSMGKYEVYQSLYEAIMGTNPSGNKTNTFNPVENMDFWDAILFCNKLSTATGLTPYYNVLTSSSSSTSVEDWTVGTDCYSYTTTGSTGFRLPTIWEWEFAARGGDPLDSDHWTSYYSGAKSTGADETFRNRVAWNSSNSSKTQPEYSVPNSQYCPNRLGIYNMSGNVWEWTQTTYSSNTAHKWQCGGSFKNDKRCGVSTKGHEAKDHSDTNTGFRLVRSYTY